MSGRNGTAGRRGGRKTAPAPVITRSGSMDMDAKDIEAVYELERMYLHERKRREDAEAELLAERAAHAETRERCAEALRAARAGVTLAADFEAKRQQAETEKRAAMETARAVGAFGDATQKEVAGWAGVSTRTVKAWEAWEKIGAHDKLPRVIKPDGSVETYSRLLRKDYLACKAWCESYKMQKANAEHARRTIGR